MKAKGNLRPLIDENLVSALSHPLRVHILDVLSERVASPSDLAREAGLNVNYVAYHVKELEKIGFLELVKTEPRRGTIEHYYRARRKFIIEDPEWERLPAPIKRGLSANLFQAIIGDVREALVAGTFDEHNGHMSRTRLLVDKEGWGDLNAALAETLERVLSIQAESAERLEASGEEAIPVAVSMVGFETAPKPEPEAKASSAG
jgi:DNA-binding transcriptional ArsR family regulator